jgi:hypothetical protein
VAAFLRGNVELYVPGFVMVVIIVFGVMVISFWGWIIDIPCGVIVVRGTATQWIGVLDFHD